MAGTGSELDMGAVITVGETHKKEVLMHPLVNPKFSILDPEYTFTVPERHSMAGVADILCHLMEQYFTPDVNAHVQDRMNEGVVKAIRDLLLKSYFSKNENNAMGMIPHQLGYPTKIRS